MKRKSSWRAESDNHVFDIYCVFFFIPDKNGRVNCFRSFGYKKERVRKYPFLPFTTGCFVGWLEVICAS